MPGPTPAPRPDSVAGARSKANLIPPYAVLGCSAIFFWSLSVRTVIFTLMPAVATELRLSSSIAGVAIASLLLGNNLGSWSAGFLPGGRYRRILVSALLMSFSVVILSTAQDEVALLVTGFLLGLGSGVYLPLGLAIITDAGGMDRKARYVSIHEVAATIAMFAGAAFVAATIDLVEWRTVLLIWCPIGILALLVFLRVRIADTKPARKGTAVSIRPDRVMAYCVLGFACSSVLIGGLIAVLPLIMVRGWGIDQSEAAAVVGYTRLAGLIGVGLAGLRADRWGYGRTLRALQALGLAGSVVISFSGYGLVFLAGLLAVAVAASGMVTVLPAVIANAYPIRHRDRAMSISIGAGGLVGSVAAPALFGFLVDLGLPNVPMMLCSLVTLAALVMTGNIPSRSDPVAGEARAASAGPLS